MLNVLVNLNQKTPSQLAVIVNYKGAFRAIYKAINT